MDRWDTQARDTFTIIADRTHRRYAPRLCGVAVGKQIAVLTVTLIASALVLAACSSGAKVTPVTTATVQAAATQVAPTVASAQTAVAPTVAAAQTAVGSAVQGTATGVAPTVAAAQTAVVSAVQGTATGVAPTVAAAQTQVSSTVTAVGSAVQGTATGVAPTVVAAQTAIGSAVQGTASAVAPTVAAAQTAIAPTVVAAQTAVAPTRNALATQVVATFGPPIATSTAASPIQITAANVSQADTTVTLRNSGTGPVNISAWLLMTGNTAVILPVDQALRIQPNATLTLHFSTGTNTATDYYLGQLSPGIANSVKPGDRLILVTLTGAVASVYQLS